MDCSEFTDDFPAMKNSDSEDDQELFALDDDIPDHCCCLLRERCLFDKKSDAIFRSTYFCSNFSKAQCMNKFWDPCLETAGNCHSLCRYCDDQIYNNELRIKRNIALKNALGMSATLGMVHYLIGRYVTRP